MECGAAIGQGVPLRSFRVTYWPCLLRVVRRLDRRRTAAPNCSYGCHSIANMDRTGSGTYLEGAWSLSQELDSRHHAALLLAGRDSQGLSLGKAFTTRLQFECSSMQQCSRCKLARSANSFLRMALTKSVWRRSIQTGRRDLLVVHTSGERRAV